MKTTNVLVAVAVLASLTPLSALGQDTPVRDCTAYRLTGKIHLDGKLDEQAWTDLPEHTGFRWNRAPETYAAYQSSFRIGYDDEAIYAGIRADEPRISEHLEVARKRDTGKIDSRNQGFEILISPETREGLRHYQFAVDILGHKMAYQAKLAGKPYEFKKTEWAEAEATWEAAVSTGSDFYTMEFRLPLATLGAKPKPGQKWKLLIGRQGTWVPKGSGLHWSIASWSAWNPLSHWRNVPKHGHVQFAPEPLTAGIAGKLTRQINEDFYAWQHTDRKLAALLARTQGKTNLLADMDRKALKLNGVPFSWHDLKRERSLAMPQVFLFEWDTPIEFNCVVIDWTNPSVYAKIYGLEYWTGSDWRLAFTETDHKGPRSCHIFDKAAATKVRLTVAEHTSNLWFWMKINELGLFLVDGDSQAATSTRED